MKDILKILFLLSMGVVVGRESYKRTVKAKFH